MASRPAQGNNSTPAKLKKWNPKPQPAPRVFGTGSVSHPSEPGRWTPKAQPGPKVVQG